MRKEYVLIGYYDFPDMRPNTEIIASLDKYEQAKELWDDILAIQEELRNIKNEHLRREFMADAERYLMINTQHIDRLILLRIAELKDVR